MPTCEHCKKETAISFEEWLDLTRLMMTFSALDQSQKELILLMVDGCKFRMANR